MRDQNCERGLGCPEHRHRAPEGPLDQRNEVYRQTQKQNSAEKAQQALQGGVQPPVKNRGEITKLYKPQQDKKKKKNQDQRKGEVGVQTPGQHFLRLPKYHKPFQPN